MRFTLKNGLKNRKDWQMEQSYKVLVVDDEESIRMSLSNFLEDEGFEVFQAGNVKDGLKTIEREKPACTIVDVRLPDGDGDALILEAWKFSPDTSFIIYTGSMDYVISPSLKKTGIDHERVFFKPVKDVTVLGKAVRKAVGLKE